MNADTPGHVIRRARQETRLTQAQLATELGVHKNTVADWEKGKYFPDRHWAALNKRLRISLTPPGMTPAAPDPPPIPDDVMAVIEKNYPPERQAEIIEMLTELSERPAEPAPGDRSRRPGGASERAG